MKKILSVALAAIMLFCCIPFAASAAGTAHTYNSNVVFANGDTLVGGDTYTVSAGVTVTVPAGVTLYIPSGTAFHVQQGGKLNVYGHIITFGNATLSVEGDIIGSGNVTGEGSHIARINFPNLESVGLKNRIKVFWASAKTLTETLTWNPVDDNGGFAMANLNQYLFVKAAMIDPDCEAAGYDILDKNYASEKRYDDSRMSVYLNGVQIPYDKDSCRTVFSNSGDISYRSFTNEDTFLKVHKVYLPTGKGFEVIGRNGELSDDGTVLLKHGQPFSFRVELDEAYDMSNFKVYVYNGYGWLNIAGEVQEGEFDPSNITDGLPALQPDEDGYFTIPSVRRDCTVHVVGILQNSTVTLIGNIMETFRTIFNMFKEFFDSFIALFKGLGGQA